MKSAATLRNSFRLRRRKHIRDDEQSRPRIDSNGYSNSNSNLVKPKQSKSFLRRRRRRYSSSSPPSLLSHDVTQLKTDDYSHCNRINHIDDDDDDDDPFSTLSNAETPIHPLGKLTYRIRKSFRNSLTRQRSRLESTNSKKHLIVKKHDENIAVETVTSPISTGLTSPIAYSIETAPSTENNKIKISSKRRKAPLAPSLLSQSTSTPNEYNSIRSTADNSPLDCALPSNDQQQQNSFTKKNKFNQSFRSRLSSLLKRRRAKQQQQHIRIRNSIDDDLDYPHHDESDDVSNKKLTLGQRFDALRCSLHLGKRNSTNKGKQHLLANE